MTDTSVIEIVLQALILVAKVAGPILATSLAIGLTVSLIQSVTQVQEMTLVFVPKMIGVALVLLVAGHWMLSQLIAFTDQMYALLPRLLAG